MDSISPFLMAIIFIFYGLSFFVLGFGILLLNDKRSYFALAKALFLLGIFGILHGLQEWADMLLYIGHPFVSPKSEEVLQHISLFFESISFYFLLCFGAFSLYLLKVKNIKKVTRVYDFSIISILAISGLVYLGIRVTTFSFVVETIIIRYFFGFTGALLSGIAFLCWLRDPEIKYLTSRWVKIGFAVTGVSFVLYSILTGVIVPKADFFPANIINKEVFLSLIGVPIQFFRMICAIGAAIFVFGILNIFSNEDYKIRKGSDLEHEANFDALTKLRNRRSLYTIIQKECMRSDRYHRPLSLIYIDIDNFKEFNDNYGRDAGDSVLLRLGELFAKKSRSSDYVFRMGGEEFLLLTPEIDLKSSVEFAERLRKLVKEFKFYPNNSASSMVITVSIGCAEYHPGMNISEFIAHGDRAMYLAKHNGRDQVRVFES